MTAVIIQSNKIVSSEVKDNQTLLEPSYGKRANESFGRPNELILGWPVIFSFISHILFFCFFLQTHIQIKIQDLWSFSLAVVSLSRCREIFWSRGPPVLLSFGFFFNRTGCSNKNYISYHPSQVLEGTLWLLVWRREEKQDCFSLVSSGILGK